MTRAGTLLFSIAIAATSIACGSSGVTSTTGPTATRCQITATSSPSSFGVSGGDGTVSISVARECAWTAAAQANWISITSAKDGQGDGSVSYHVAANPDPAIRSGSITVGDQRADISQAAAPCRFDVTAPADPVAATGGSTGVTVQTNSACTWTAVSGASWATVSPASGSGNATVQVTVTPNAGAARTADVTVAGTRVTVAQLSAPPVSAPPPPPAPAPPPTPAPPPSPTPPPPVPPPPAQTINLSGRVSNVHGTCPSLTFTLSSHLVRTSPATVFANGPCKDLENDQQVSVQGTLRDDGSVDALKVTFDK